MNELDSLLEYLDEYEWTIKRTPQGLSIIHGAYLVELCILCDTFKLILRIEDLEKVQVSLPLKALKNTPLVIKQLELLLAYIN